MPILLRPRQRATNRPVPAMNQGNWAMPSRRAHGAIGPEPFFTFTSGTRCVTPTLVLDLSAGTTFEFKLRFRYDSDTLNQTFLNQDATLFRLSIPTSTQIQVRINAVTSAFTAIEAVVGQVYDLSIKGDGVNTLDLALTNISASGATGATQNDTAAYTPALLATSPLHFSTLSTNDQNYLGPFKGVTFERPIGNVVYFWPMNEGEGATFFETEVGGNTFDAEITVVGGGFWTP